MSLGLLIHPAIVAIVAIESPTPWNPYRVPISDNLKKYSKKGLTAARILVNFEKSRGTERTAKNKKGSHRSPLYRLTR